MRSKQYFTKIKNYPHEKSTDPFTPPALWPSPWRTMDRTYKSFGSGNRKSKNQPRRNKRNIGWPPHHIKSSNQCPRNRDHPLPQSPLGEHPPQPSRWPINSTPSRCSPPDRNTVVRSYCRDRWMLLQLCRRRETLNNHISLTENGSKTARSRSQNINHI